MGTTITDWAVVEGAYYTGHGGGEVLWFLVAVILSVGALVVGGMHEKTSYRKMKK